MSLSKKTNMFRIYHCYSITIECEFLGLFRKEKQGFSISSGKKIEIKQKKNMKQKRTKCEINFPPTLSYTTSWVNTRNQGIFWKGVIVYQFILFALAWFVYVTLIYRYQ